MNIYELPPDFELKESEFVPQVESSDHYKSIFTQNIEPNYTNPRAVLFKNQYINQRWAFVYSLDNTHILQSAYLKPDDLLLQIKNKSKLNSRKLDSSFSYLMGYNHDFANYYHWVLQCFPTLMLFRAIKEKNCNIKLLLPENLPAFAIEYLKQISFLKFDDIVFLNPKQETYFAENLYYPSFIGGEFAFNISPSIIEFYDEFTNSILDKKRNLYLINHERKLSYFDRLDSRNRKILNEHALIDFLKSRFEFKIHSNNDSIINQIINFHTSDIIISPHGAGLSNLLFCRKKTVVLELMPGNYLNPCFATIAINKALDYQLKTFPIKKATNHQHSTEWEINLLELEEIIKHFLK